MENLFDFLEHQENKENETSKKELEGICRSSGADFFIEKNADWQHRLYSMIYEFVNGAQEV